MSKKQKPWREVLLVYEAADLFPLLSAEELRALADDIAKHGLREPVDIWRAAYAPMTLLDGRNRLDALELLGCEIFHTKTKKGEEIDWFHQTCVGNSPSFRVFQVKTLYEDPTAYVISKNIHRRHLTADKKRELIGKLLKLDPEKSNNAIATTVKADDKTVASVREELETTSEIPKLTKTRGKDGKVRPARRKPAAGKALSPPPDAPEKPAASANPDAARKAVEASANPGAEASAEARKAVNAGRQQPAGSPPPAAEPTAAQGEPMPKTWEIAKQKGKVYGVSLEDLKRGACDDDLLSDGEYLALTADELRACIDEIGFIVIRYSDGTLYAKPVLDYKTSGATAQSDPAINGGSSHAMLLEEIRSGIRRPTHPHAKTRSERAMGAKTCAKVIDQKPKPLDLPADGSIPAFMDRTKRYGQHK